MTTTTDTAARVWPIICPGWCAGRPADHADHDDPHESGVTSVPVDGDNKHVFVNIQQGLTRGSLGSIAVYCHDDELFTAPAPAMRSLAAQLIAAADLLEGLSEVRPTADLAQVRAAALARTCPRSDTHGPHDWPTMVAGQDWRCPGSTQRSR